MVGAAPSAYSIADHRILPRSISMGVRMSRALPYSVRSIQFLLLFFGVVALAGCLREKDRLDAQVREMCAKDGGAKVYEQVALPAEKFDEFGVVSVPVKASAKAGDEFFYEWDITYYKKGNPEMWRSHFKLIRHVDGKLLGESVVYSRRGGDFPGPWHDSSYGCPKDQGMPFVKKQVFVRAAEEKK